MTTDYLGNSSNGVLSGKYISKSGKPISYRFAKAGEFIGIDLVYPKATKEDVEEFLRDVYSKSGLKKSQINELIQEFNSKSSVTKYNSGGIKISFDVLSKAMESVNQPKKTIPQKIVDFFVPGTDPEPDARKVALEQEDMLRILDNHRRVSQYNETFDENIVHINEKIEETDKLLQENAKLSKETEDLRLVVPKIRQNIVGKITDTSSSKELEDAITLLRSQNDEIIAHNQRVSNRQGVIIKTNSNNTKIAQKFIDASVQIIRDDGVLTDNSTELLSYLSSDTMPLESVEAKNEDLASFIRRDSENASDLIVGDSVSLRTVVNRSIGLVMDRSSQLTAINADFERSSSRKIDIIKPVQTFDAEIQKLEQKLTAAKAREAEEAARKKAEEEGRMAEEQRKNALKADLKRGLGINISDFETQQKGFGKRVADAGNSVNSYSTSRESRNKELAAKRSQLEERRKVLSIKPDMSSDLESQLKAVQKRITEINNLNDDIASFNTSRSSLEDNLTTECQKAQDFLRQARENLEHMQAIQENVNAIIEGVKKAGLTAIEFTVEELHDMGLASATESMNLRKLQDFVASAVSASQGEFTKAQQIVNSLQSKLADELQNANEILVELKQEETRISQAMATEKSRQEVIAQLGPTISGFGDSQRLFKQRIQEAKDSISQHNSTLATANDAVNESRKGLDSERGKLDTDFKPEGATSEEQLKSVQGRKVAIQFLNTRISNFNTRKDAIAENTRKKLAAKKDEAESSLAEAEKRLQEMLQVQDGINDIVKGLTDGGEASSIIFTQRELNSMGFSAGGSMSLADLQGLVNKAVSRATIDFEKAQKELTRLNSKFAIAKVEPLSRERVKGIANLEAQLQKEQAIEAARTVMLQSIAGQFTKARESSQKLKGSLNTIEIQSNNFEVYSYSAKEQRTEANSIIASVKKEVGELPKVPADEPGQTTQSKIDAVSKRIEEINQKVAEATKGIEANNTEIFKLKQLAKTTVTDLEEILLKAKEEFGKAKQAQTQLAEIVGTFGQSLRNARLSGDEISNFSLTRDQLVQAVGEDNVALFKDLGDTVTLGDLTTVMGNIVAAAEQNVNTASQNVASIRSRLAREFEGVSPKDINIDTNDLGEQQYSLEQRKIIEQVEAENELKKLVKNQASVFLSANDGVASAADTFNQINSAALQVARNTREPIGTRVADVEDRRKKLLENEEIPDGETDEQKRQRITERKTDIEKLRSDIDELGKSIDQANLTLATQGSLVSEAKRIAEIKLQYAETQLKGISETAEQIETLAKEYRRSYGNGATIERGVVAELFKKFGVNLPEGEEPIPVDVLLNNFNNFQDAIKQKISSLREEFEKEDIVFNQIEQIPEFNQELGAQITSIQQVLDNGSAVPRGSGPEDDEPLSLSVAPQNQNTRPKNTPIGGDSGSIIGGAILEGANGDLLHTLSGDNLGMFSEILDDVSQLGDRGSMREGMLNNAAFGKLASNYADAAKGVFVGAGKDGKGGYVIQAAALGDFDITKEPIEITMTLGKGANARSFAWLMPQEELYAVDKDGNKVGEPMKFEEAQKALGGKISLPRNQDVIKQTEFRSLANQQIENPQPEHQPQQNTSSQGAPSVDFASNDSLKQELETCLKRLISDPSPEIVINPQLFSNISRAYSELQKALPDLDLTLEQIVEYSLPENKTERSSITLDENAERMSSAILSGFSKIKSMGENGKTAADIRAIVIKPKDDVSRGQ